MLILTAKIYEKDEAERENPEWITFEHAGETLKFLIKRNKGFDKNFVRVAICAPKSFIINREKDAR